MRSILLSMTILCLACAVVPVYSHAAAKEAVRGAHEKEMIREVMELERHSREASLHNDAAFSDRVLADSYVAIGPLGTIITKSEILDTRGSSRLHYDFINLTEMVVRIYGETAVVTAKAEVKGTDSGEEFSGPYRYTRVWIKQNGAWRAVSYQATVTR
jgi:hypothetical protein